MYELEVGDISPIRRDLLNMTVDVMLSLAAIAQLVHEASQVHHGVSRLLVELLHRMDPDIDVAIIFADWIFSERYLLRLAFFPRQLALALAHLVVVLDGFQLQRLAVVV